MNSGNFRSHSFQNYLKQLCVFEKNQNISVYMTLATLSRPSLLHKKTDYNKEDYIKKKVYLHIIKVLYKHKLKGIKQNPQIDSKVLCLSSLAIIFRLLVCRQSINS